MPAGGLRRPAGLAQHEGHPGVAEVAEGVGGLVDDPAVGGAPAGVGVDERTDRAVVPCGTGADRAQPVRQPVAVGGVHDGVLGDVPADRLQPAVLGVPLRIYALATLLGIIPASYVYATAGAGLGTLLAQGEGISVGGSLTPEVVVALSGLGVLALLPVLYKRYLGRRGAARHESPPAVD